MKTIISFLNQLLCIFVISIVLIFSFLPVSPTYADDFDLPPSVIDIASTFSDRYCIAISEGVSAEKAGEVAARQMISGLMFSSALKQVMAVPKEDMATLLASNIYDGCGDDIGISEQDLNNHILELATKGPATAQAKPFNPSSLVSKGRHA